MSESIPNALTFTGERFAPEVTGTIWYEHWHRYCAVQALAKGRTVLDAACGEGYGSFLLAAAAKDVVGIDIAPEAVAHARSRYVAPNLRYAQGSCSALPLADASVDLVVSFETIEHLWEQAEMLAEFRRVLAPGGVLVISSPNQPVYSEFGAHVNDFHVRELTRAELAALLDPVFPRQRWYAQRVVAHSALWAEDADPAKPGAASLLTLGDDGVRPAREPGPPMYFVVVCAADDVRLPALPALSLFDDGRQSLYNDYRRALLREKQLYWEELDARKVAEDRLAELITATNDLASERQKSAALTDRMTFLEEAYGPKTAALKERLRSVEAACDAAQSELVVEREYATSLSWEERNARNIAESRLAELITTVNVLASEREKLAAVGARAASLEATLAAVQSDLAAERERATALLWEERNWRKVADERLAELIPAVNGLANEREKSATLTARLATLEQAISAAQSELGEARARGTAFDTLRKDFAGASAELAAARGELSWADAELTDLSARLSGAETQLAEARAAVAQANDDLQRRSAALTESQSRLAYRETVIGWLRFPLAWLRMRLRASG